MNIPFVIRIAFLALCAYGAFRLAMRLHRMARDSDQKYFPYFLSALFGTRWRIALLYLGTAACCLVIMAFLTGNPDGVLFHPLSIMWFPSGIMCLLSIEGGVSGLICYWVTVGFYALATTLGTLLKNRWIYLVFVLVLGANIGGCTKMLAENRQTNKENQRRHAERMAKQQQFKRITTVQSPQELRTLISKGFNPHYFEDFNTPPLVYTVIEAPQNLNPVIGLLDVGANIDARDHRNRTAVYIAAETGNIELLRLLVERGADLQSVYQGTPLHRAASNGHLECVQLLLESGANIFSHVAYFGTPLDCALKASHDEVAHLIRLSAEAALSRLLIQREKKSARDPQPTEIRVAEFCYETLTEATKFRAVYTYQDGATVTNSYIVGYLNGELSLLAFPQFNLRD
jgi:hypothetical protein